MGSHAARTHVDSGHRGTVLMWVVFAAAIALLAVAALLSAEAAAGVSMPWFTIEPESGEMYGGGWSLESQVTVQIDDASTPGGPEFTGYDATDDAGWFDLPPSQFDIGFDIAPGDTVAVTVGGLTRVHTVRFLTVSGFNLGSDAVWGNAAAGATVTVSVRNDADATAGGRTAVTLGAGDWSVDFTDGIGEDYDVRYGTTIRAQVTDENGNSTQARLQILDPAFGVNPKNDSVFGEGYPASQPASLTVDDSENGEGVDYSVDIECDEYGKFGVADIGFDITPTDTVTISRGAYTKSHVVTNVKTGGVEQSSDVVTGTADPGTAVSVYIMDLGEPMPARHTTADGTGFWTVSFETSVSPDPEGAAVDIGPGVRGYAEQRDADLDSTQDDWRIPAPWVGVGIVDDGVWGGDFLPSTDVTVTIDDTTVAGIEYTAVVQSDDIGGIFARPIYGEGAPFDILAGMVVSATDGTRTATHEVLALTVDEASAASDIITGTAEPNAPVQVVVYLDEGESPMRFLTADGAGVWVADFTVASDIYGWAQVYDIPPGQHMTAIRNAAGGNHTQIDFNMPVQPVAVADEYEIWEDMQLDTGDEGVRDNDTRSGFWDDVVEVQQQPAHGDLVMQPGGTFLYTPDPDYNGDDLFLYRLVGGDLVSNVVTAAITVHPEPDATALTNSSASQVLAYGATYTLSGKLTCGAAPVVGRGVVLQQATSATGPWSNTPVTANTAADGSFSLAVKPYYKRYYRARFADEAGEYLASESPATYALPRAWVGTPVAPATMYSTRTYYVYGFLKPRHTAGSYPVRIYRYRYYGGKWVAWGYQWAKAYDYSAYTRYLASVRLPYKGYWRLRAYAPADAWHAAAWSSTYDTVLVK